MIEDRNYYEIHREEWQTFHQDSIPTITEEELKELTSLNDRLSLEDVKDVYVPLVHMFDIYLQQYRNLQRDKSRFLGRSYEPSPLIIGVTGSVAVGKVRQHVSCRIF